MSQTVNRITHKGDGILDAITDTKQAAVFATLGLKFKSPGVFVTYDKDNPLASGGIAHFCFESTEQNSVGKLQQVWEAADADIALDRVLETLPPSVSEAVTAAIIVYGRRILENYRELVHFIKTQSEQFVIVGGEEVPGVEGAKQGFIIKKLPRKKVRK